MITEETRKDFTARYAKLVSNHTIWLFTAQRLYAAASVLAAEIGRRWNATDFRKSDEQRNLINDRFLVSDFQPAYMMLIGFVLENLFKACLVQNNKESFRNEVLKSGKLPSELLSHDLKKLAQSCDIPVENDVGPKLDRIAKFSVWRGRYHFPLTFEAFYHITPQNDSPSSGISFSQSDVQEISSFVESLSDSLGFDIHRQAAA